MRRRRPFAHSASGYVYPFPSRTTTTGRTDMGVDFGGSGGIVAIGRAKIIKTGKPAGWPGTGGILYQLLDGPHRGRAVYVYEGVRPTVKPGEVVEAGQNIGTILPGTSTGIEIGWADLKTGQPIASGGYVEGQQTPAGRAFKTFIGGLSRRYVSKPGFGGIPSGAEEAGKIGVGGIYGVPGLKQAEQLVEGEKSVGGLAGEIISGLLGDIHAEALMLNIGLIGGGAFLIYYGVALLAGVNDPAVKLAGLVAGRGMKGVAE